MDDKLIDHLFRHQYGKMVSILTRIFGFSHLEIIEDAVQDSFISAIQAWKKKVPDNPKAWLTKTAKNRVIDIFRKISAEENRRNKITSGSSSLKIDELFLEHEIADSQLRMIFTSCHPKISTQDQIIFALKTISGFSTKEIAAALMMKESTVKKRFQRARKTIIEKNIAFEIPLGAQLKIRLDSVMEVIYLIFNEGFHSSNKNHLLRFDLCFEAIRLCKKLLQKENLRTPKLYALLALLCFHAARFHSKTDTDQNLINLQNQDRSLWNYELCGIGNNAMDKALENNEPLSSYHFEAAIASEHLRAPSFDKTNWQNILHWYQLLDNNAPSDFTKLNIAIVYLQLKNYSHALHILDRIEVEELGARAYLYFSTLAEFYAKNKDFKLALKHIDRAIELVNNLSEKDYLISKKSIYQNQLA